MWSKSRVLRPARDLSAALAALCAATLLAPARAQPTFDPTVVQRFVPGPPPGPAPMEGLDARNSGLSRTPLPLSIAVGFRTRVPHGIAHSIATDHQGRWVIAHAVPRVSEYDRSGKLVWTARTNAEPAAGPVILSDGTRLVLTTTAELFGFSPAGARRFRHALPISELRSPPLIVALRDGGAAVSNGHDVLRIGQSGEVTFRDRLSGTVRALVEWQADLLAVTESGELFRHRTVSGFTLLENFGGRTPDGAALSKAGILSAVVDGHRVVDLELSMLARRVRFFEPALTLAGPPLVLDGGETRTIAAEGLVLGQDRSGTETLRVPLQVSTTFGSAEAREPRPIADARATLAVARRGQAALLVSADGRTTAVEGTACAEPLRPTPLAPNSLLLACRSGQIWRVDPAP